MGIFKRGDGWLCQFTVSEVKILIIFCYLLAANAVLWTIITYNISKTGEYSIQIGSYFRCSANGIHDLLDCEQYREEFEALTIQELHVLYLILIAFLNLSNLPLIIEYKSVKDKIKSTLGHNAVKEIELPSHTGKRSEMPSHIT